MGSKISTTRLYVTRGRTIFVASPNECPRVNLVRTSAKFKDDYSKGFKTSKALIEVIFS